MKIGDHTLEFRPMKISQARKALFQVSNLLTTLVPSENLSGVLQQDKVHLLQLLGGSLKQLFETERNLDVYESILEKFKSSCMVVAKGNEMPLTDAMYETLFAGQMGKEIEFVAEGLTFHFADFLAMMGNVLPKKGEGEKTTE